jgi:CPA2 family monovalent cation:H+ antiporter-2
MIHTARTLNPNIEIVMCADSADEMQLLKEETQANSDIVFLGEEELAKGMTNHVLTRFLADTAKDHKTH